MERLNSSLNYSVKFRKKSLGIMLTLDLYLVVISVKTTSRHYLDEEVLRTVRDL